MGEGNDTISIDDLKTIAAYGAMSNVQLQLYGDLNQGPGAATLGGNDCISLTNSTFAARGDSETAILEIRGDFDLLSTITAGDDQVKLFNVTVNADDTNAIVIDTAFGNDDVKVECSCFHTLIVTLGDGADDTWLNDNSFTLANLDGGSPPPGAGIDRLFKSNNDGTVTHQNFEEVNGQPYP